jgi:hypothetical protein
MPAPSLAPQLAGMPPEPTDQQRAFLRGVAMANPQIALGIAGYFPNALSFPN